jgi:uncharacterized YccA/Bax inhibitor family protein
MTIEGTVKKTLVLLTIVALAAFNSYSWVALGDASLKALALGGAFGGLAVGWFTIANPKASPFTAPLYALIEGLAIGAVTFSVERAQPGIALPAVGLTFAALGAVLLLWRAGLLRASRFFHQVLLISMLAILSVYVGSMVATVAGFPAMWLHHHPVVNGFAILVASLCFVVDFEQIRQGVVRKAPAYMEWYGAFSLLVTLVWLYLELLKLLGGSE